MCNQWLLNLLQTWEYKEKKKNDKFMVCTFKELIRYLGSKTSKNFTNKHKNNKLISATEVHGCFECI